VSEKNRHHYVPRFYLRAFASSPRRIHLYNIRRDVVIRDASLRDQCHAHRLYGNNGVEDAFAGIESRAARVLAALMCEVPEIPERGSSESQLLFTFLALQLRRTLGAAVGVREMSAAFNSAVFEGSSPPWFANADDAMELSLSAAQFMAHTLIDLAVQLVRAPEHSSFVTSDNPVFCYNLYCEGIVHSGVTGTRCGGFQLFFPLSPRVLLVAYDARVYKVGTRSGQRVALARERDVAELNRLQFVSAHRNVYFNDASISKTCGAMSQSVSRIRAQDKPRVVVAVDVDDDRSELVHQFRPMPDLGLRLSFVSIRKDARRIPLQERAHRHRDKPKTVRTEVEDSAGYRTFVVQSQRERRAHSP
jgi:hypothetical protein